MLYICSESNSQFIIIKIHCFDRGINQPLPLFLFSDISIYETTNPEIDLLFHKGRAVCSASFFYVFDLTNVGR